MSNSTDGLTRGQWSGRRSRTPRPAAPTAAPGVDVWVVRVDQREAVDRCRALLPAAETGRLGELAPPHRDRRICAHAALRILAAAALGQRPPLHALVRDTDGRLVLPRADAGDAPFELSLSHAGSYAAIAFSRCGAVGVDIEVPGALSGVEERRLARYAMAEPEYARWCEAAAEQRSTLLTRAWTRKEAVLKALGTGLAGDVRTVVTSSATAEPEAEVPSAAVAAAKTGSEVRVLGLPMIAGDPAQWTVRDLPEDSLYLGSIAVRATYAEVRHHDCSIVELL